ncbi:MAG: DEAD/DEAH box helicase family protein [Candidatus Coatesbacteria bacterium]|nr:DEAD/DEAH box helicase family protein [Candidatus Coatesbacteria bacterium]
MQTVEATAKIKIIKMLEESGWRVFDSEKGRANVFLEDKVKFPTEEQDNLGKDFEKTKFGFIDVLLLDEKNFPVAVLEAKRESKNPLDGKEQARRYANSIKVRFVILSNGISHYFWDLQKGNPYQIIRFPNLESLFHTNRYEPNPENLVREEVKEDYIVLTQDFNYCKKAEYLDEKSREGYIKICNLKFLRKYQVEAVRSIQEAVKENKDRFLFEMATGTGKTLIAAAVAKLFLRTKNASRVLFLVDRIELEIQAGKNLYKYLTPDFKTVVFKENFNDWKNAEIVVSTVQTLLFNNKHKRYFVPTDFDLIISDEAHRSIGGNSRAVFDYFVGYKLGLTATPKDYLKKVDESDLSRNDPRQLERRQLLDTYKTFGCESGNPTFRYSLIDGVKDGFLINPIVVDARTEITTELLSEQGYSVMVEDKENGTIAEKFFYHRDFEKKFFSDETNLIFCDTFLKNALKDPITGEIGKSIVFCVSQNHASKIAQLLNQLADRYFPNMYNSDFAVQVTSDVTNPEEMSKNFVYNKLNGNSDFIEDYRTSKTRVCVTVGMMTTGYDCEDILNLCLMRPIFSPTDFVQIKGRGTRKFTFQYKETSVEKERYKLFDFFANCEYFEEKFNYDEVLDLPSMTKSKEIIGQDIYIDDKDLFKDEGFESTISDPLKQYKETVIGAEGMKPDRMLFERFQDKVKTNEFVQKKVEEGSYDELEHYIKENIFEKPEDYFNLNKIRQALRLDRRITIKEVVQKIFGLIDTIKSKDELLEDEFEKFLTIYKPDSEYAMLIKSFMKAYITDNEIRDIIDKKEFGKLHTNPKFSMIDLKDLKKDEKNDWSFIIPEYIKDYVNLNRFM